MEIVSEKIITGNATTVGELKKALQPVDDDLPIEINGWDNTVKVSKLICVPDDGETRDYIQWVMPYGVALFLF